MKNLNLFVENQRFSDGLEDSAVSNAALSTPPIMRRLRVVERDWLDPRSNRLYEPIAFPDLPASSRETATTHSIVRREEVSTVRSLRRETSDYLSFRCYISCAYAPPIDILYFCYSRLFPKGGKSPGDIETIRVTGRGRYVVRPRFHILVYFA